ncbi:unnamed protein product, partial [Laminaria digitata]
FLQAAACELEEEAHLHEGTWHPLMKNAETVAGAGKYSTQIFHPYLVVDPVVKGEPRGLDDGEFIEYIRGVSLEEVRKRLVAFTCGVIFADRLFSGSDFVFFYRFLGSIDFCCGSSFAGWVLAVPCGIVFVDRLLL